MLSLGASASDDSMDLRSLWACNFKHDLHRSKYFSLFNCRTEPDGAITKDEMWPDAKSIQLCRKTWAVDPTQKVTYSLD